MTETTRKALPFWLVASVLINMILIGLVAGLFLRPQPGPAPNHERRWAASESSVEDRRAVRTIMVKGIDASKAEIEQRREAERALVALLRAEPFDPGAANSALEVFRAADCKAREAIAAAIFSELSELTPDQRAIAARYLASGIDRRGRHRGEGERPRTPPGP